MKSKLYLLAIILLALLGVKSLFHTAFYTSHDGRHQIIRLMHFHQGLVNGQLPVRWAGTAFHGYGYPLFIFTYRLPFWLAEGWYLLAGNLGEAIKFVFIITFVFSGLTMYWLAQKIWQSKLAGFLSAILYLWAPYRFSNIFVRAALGEAVSFVFMPLIFLGIWGLSKESKKSLKWFLVLILGLGGAVLSHAITLGLWFLPLIFWFIYCFYQSKNRKKYFIYSFLAGLLSLGLTAYYWLPAAAERKYVKFTGAIGNYYQAHFVTLKQLIYSRWGYGFSFPGVENDMMSFQVGLGQWLIVFLSLFLLTLYLISSFYRKLKLNQKVLPLLLYFLAIFFLSIYFMLDYSAWFYPLINRFFTIDIPWRFLGISVFSASILAGALTVILKKNWFKWGLISLILALVFYTNRNHLRVNQYVYLPESEYWQSAETSNEYDDYAPRWFNFAADQRDPELTTLKGESENQLKERKSNLFVFQSQVKSGEAEVATKLAYYPGWQAKVDGQETEIYYEEDGRIRVILDQGEHLIELFFKETKLRLISNWISLASLILLTGGLVITKRKIKA